MKKTWMISATAGVLAAALLCDCGAPAATADSGGSQAGEQSVEGQSSEGQLAVQPATQSTRGTAGRTGGRKAAKRAVITFWHPMSGINGEALDYLMSQFSEKNKLGVKVEAQYQGEYDDTISKLKSAQIGNMGTDLMQIYDIGTRFMIDLGWVILMQELVNGDDQDKSVIEPNIATYYTVDERPHSMPFDSSTPLLYYNRNMFEKVGISKVPESLGEITDAVDALVRRGGAGEPISLGIYGWFFEQFICRQGLSYVNNSNGKQGAATAMRFDQNGAAADTLAVRKDLYDRGYALIIGRGGDSRLVGFSPGKSAMTLGSTASLKQILEDVDGKFEVGIAYFPKVNPEDKGGVSIGGASLWALSNEDETKKAATWGFMKYLVSPENQAYWNVQTGYFPVTTAVHGEPVFKENPEKYPQFGAAIDQLHGSTPESADALINISPKARQVVETEVENMLDNHVNPQDTAADTAKQVNKAIEEYNLLNE